MERAGPCCAERAATDTGPLVIPPPFIARNLCTGPPIPPHGHALPANGADFESANVRNRLTFCAGRETSRSPGYLNVIPGALAPSNSRTQILARQRGAPHRSVMIAPLTPDSLLARFDALGIAHRTYAHPPVFTVEEAKSLRGTLPGRHCKSLFLKDKKGGLWLVVALEECRVDLKALSDRLSAPRFSFGSAELLYEVLGVRPGSVTPYAAINDTKGRVAVVLQQA